MFKLKNFMMSHFQKVGTGLADCCIAVFLFKNNNLQMSVD